MCSHCKPQNKKISVITETFPSSLLPKCNLHHFSWQCQHLKTNLELCSVLKFRHYMKNVLTMSVVFDFSIIIRNDYITILALIVLTLCTIWKKFQKNRDLLQINFVLKTTIYESQFLRLMVHQVSHKFFASCRGWSKLNTNFRLFPMILRKARRYLTCASIQRARARVRAHIAAAA